jgi:hypothetical protein
MRDLRFAATSCGKCARCYSSNNMSLEGETYD